MSKRAAMALAVLALPTSAGALTSRVGSWAITSNELGCTISTTSRGMLLMVQPDDGVITVTLTNHSWRSIRDGEYYTITVGLDGHTPRPFTATGIQPGQGLAPAVSFAMETSFLSDLAVARTLRLGKNGAEIAAFDLTGSGRATSALSVCMKKLKDDPFA